LAHIDPPEPAPAQPAQTCLSDQELREKAVTELFRAKYGALVVMLMTVKGAPRDVAEVAVQEAFVELWKRWDTVIKPYAWLCKAVRSHFYKICNTQRREYALAEEAYRVPDRSAEFALSALEDEQWADQLMQHLTPAAREIFEEILRGASQAEVAAFLCKTPNAVRQGLHSARSQLKQRLGPDYTINGRTGPAPGRGEDK
jgi:RNA polymerase sigma factor (sigma-70 family)